jgi:hypothetical protein
MYVAPDLKVRGYFLLSACFLLLTLYTLPPAT